jgi:phage FluMu gp28-like protein
MTSARAKFFMPYQKNWIEDDSRLKLMEKSRQIGMSWSTAYSAVRRAAAVDARLDVWVSSRDDVQAKLFLEDCRHWAGVLKLAARELGEMVVGDDGKASASVLEFANGRRIYSLSSNPNALAGKRGHVILDEFALHKDQRTLYRVAKPVTQWGGQLEIISTHRGAGTVFNELIRGIVEKGNPMGWSHHRITLADAVDAGLVEKINAKSGGAETREAFMARTKAECIDDEQWLQEYCCVPADDSSAFITYEMISSCEYPAGMAWEWNMDSFQDAKNELYAGVDIGRDNDLTACWIFEKVSGVYFLRKRIELQNVSFSDQEANLYPYFALPQLRRVCIDQTGIGRQFAERAAQQFGQYKIEGIAFTNSSKEEMAYPVRSAFEDKSLRLPGDPLIAADLRAIKKETTAAGNIRFTADRSKSGHSDRFWALALALHAGKNATSPFAPTVFDSPVGRSVTYRRSGSFMGVTG